MYHICLPILTIKRTHFALSLNSSLVFSMLSIHLYVPLPPYFFNTISSIVTYMTPNPPYNQFFLNLFNFLCLSFLIVYFVFKSNLKSDKIESLGISYYLQQRQQLVALRDWIVIINFL
jgi:hypothetical protein